MTTDSLMADTLAAELLKPRAAQPRQDGSASARVLGLDGNEQRMDVVALMS